MLTRQLVCFLIAIKKDYKTLFFSNVLVYCNDMGSSDLITAFLERSGHIPIKSSHF